MASHLKEPNSSAALLTGVATILGFSAKTGFHWKFTTGPIYKRLILLDGISSRCCFFFKRCSFWPSLHRLWAALPIGVMDGPYLLPPSPLIPLRLTTHSFKTAAGGRTRSVARKYWSSLVGMMIEPVPSTCSSLLTNVLTKIPKDGIGKHDDNTLCPSVRVSESFMECIFEHRNSFIFTFFFFTP